LLQAYWRGGTFVNNSAGPQSGPAHAIADNRAHMKEESADPSLHKIARAGNPQNPPSHYSIQQFLIIQAAVRRRRSVLPADSENDLVTVWGPRRMVGVSHDEVAGCILRRHDHRNTATARLPQHQKKVKEQKCQNNGRPEAWSGLDRSRRPEHVRRGGGEYGSSGGKGGKWRPTGSRRLGDG
jgi:hypothetical protein